jgi:hypothetical protein
MNDFKNITNEIVIFTLISSKNINKKNVIVKIGVFVILNAIIVYRTAINNNIIMIIIITFIIILYLLLI